MTKNLDAPKLEAHLVASPTGLAELSEVVETTLASIEGRASVELLTPDYRKIYVAYYSQNY